MCACTVQGCNVSCFNREKLAETSTPHLYRIQAGYHSALGIRVPVLVTEGRAKVAAGLLLLACLAGASPLSPSSIIASSSCVAEDKKDADLCCCPLPTPPLNLGRSGTCCGVLHAPLLNFGGCDCWSCISLLL